MDDRGANIDIVFRNGLKDYEVLPPSDLWNNIHPVIKKKTGSFIVVRAAALIAVLVTITFLASQLNREISVLPDNTVIALNGESGIAEINQAIPVRIKVATAGNRPEAVRNIVVKTEPAIPDNPQTNSLLISRVSSVNDAMVLTSGNYSLVRRSVSAGLKSVDRIKDRTDMIDITDLALYNEAKNYHRWSIAAIASPTYYSSFNPGKDDLSKQLQATEEPAMSYSGGIALSYKINKRFSIQSGLYYASLDQVVNDVNVYGGFLSSAKGSHNFEVLTTKGTIVTNNADIFLEGNGNVEKIQTIYTKDVFDPVKADLTPLNSRLNQNFSYLELPIILRYKLLDKTIGLNLIGGVSYNMLVNNSVSATIDGYRQSIGSTEGLNLLTVSSSLGMGMEYNISNKFSLNLEPTFKYYLNPFNEVTGSKLHPYSFGVFSEISYKF